jgi:enterochelin esterase-like enzyme
LRWLRLLPRGDLRLVFTPLGVGERDAVIEWAGGTLASASRARTVNNHGGSSSSGNQTPLSPMRRSTNARRNADADAWHCNVYKSSVAVIIAPWRYVCK